MKKRNGVKVVPKYTAKKRRKKRLTYKWAKQELSKQSIEESRLPPLKSATGAYTPQ